MFGLFLLGGAGRLLKALRMFRLFLLSPVQSRHLELGVLRVVPFPYPPKFKSESSVINPKIKISILICCPYSFPTEVVGRS